MIPFGDPSASYQAHNSEIDQAIKRVLDSGWYVLGIEVDKFEKEFASFHGEDFHAVGVANGTDAIAFCLRALGLGTEDEVITPSHTAIATVAGIEQAGCTPVFADIDPNTRCIDSKSIEERVSGSTRAIMPVHIYGQPAKMRRIQEVAKAHNLAMVEDCSQAHGAEIRGQKVGTFADISAFSCYPTKNLGGMGDGGVILCRSKKFAEEIKSLRQYGWNEQRESIIPGFNSRLDEIQAAIRVAKRELEKTEPYYGNFTDEELTDVIQTNIFPNAIVTYQPEMLWFMRLRPHATDPNQCYLDKLSFERFPNSEEQRFLEGTDNLKEKRSESASKNGRPEWESFDYSDVIAGKATMTDTIDQDLSLLAHAQQGMHSEGFQGCWLNEIECRVSHFHEELERQVTAGD